MRDTGLTDGERALMRDKIRALGFEKPVIFGSRAKGNYKKYSDIDIALMDCGDYKAAASVRFELDELTTPYKFDVLAFGTLNNDALKEHILRVGIPL